MRGAGILLQSKHESAPQFQSVAFPLQPFVGEVYRLSSVLSVIFTLAYVR